MPERKRSQKFDLFIFLFTFSVSHLIEIKTQTQHKYLFNVIRFLIFTNEKKKNQFEMEIALYSRGKK